MEPDEEPRTCPRCGKIEPVAVEALELARAEGWPDEWLCCECVGLADTPTPTESVSDGK